MVTRFCRLFRRHKPTPTDPAIDAAWTHDRKRWDGNKYERKGGK